MGHGTHAYYNNRECRCPVCKAGEAAYQKARRLRRDPTTLPPEAHGTSNVYVNYRCRCDLCRAAWATYMRDYHARARAARVGA